MRAVSKPRIPFEVGRYGGYNKDAGAPLPPEVVGYDPRRRPGSGGTSGRRQSRPPPHDASRDPIAGPVGTSASAKTGGARRPRRTRRRRERLPPAGPLGRQPVRPPADLAHHQDPADGLRPPGNPDCPVPRREAPRSRDRRAGGPDAPGGAAPGRAREPALRRLRRPPPGEPRPRLPPPAAPLAVRLGAGLAEPVRLREPPGGRPARLPAPGVGTGQERDAPDAPANRRHRLPVRRGGLPRRHPRGPHRPGGRLDRPPAPHRRELPGARTARWIDGSRSTRLERLDDPGDRGVRAPDDHHRRPPDEEPEPAFGRVPRRRDDHGPALRPARPEHRR